jgi:hypothetical protein
LWSQIANRHGLEVLLIRSQETSDSGRLCGAGVVASLEGMKIRKDREVILHFAKYPIQLVLGKKDGVLIYEDNLEQIEGTTVKLTSFPDGHMSHVENKNKLQRVLLEFFKNV